MASQPECERYRAARSAKTARRILSTIPCRSPERADLILQNRVLGFIIVFRARINDLSRRQIELRLTELHDRSQPELVPALRKIESLSRLGEQLLGQAQAIVSRLRV